MTTAHNYTSRSLTVYRFLCSHANQNIGHAFWNWGAVADFPYLPRVRCGKLILDRARWLVSARDLAPLETAFAGSNAAKTPDQIRALRTKVATAMAGVRARLGLPDVRLNETDDAFQRRARLKHLRFRRSLPAEPRPRRFPFGPKLRFRRSMRLPLSLPSWRSPRRLSPRQLNPASG